MTAAARLLEGYNTLDVTRQNELLALLEELHEEQRAIRPKPGRSRRGWSRRRQVKSFTAYRRRA